MQARSQLRSFLTGVCVFAGLGVAWWLAVRQGWVEPFLLPPPSQVAASGWQLIADGTLAKHILISAKRVFFGYLLSVFAAGFFAMICVHSPRLRRIVEPPLEFLRQIPPLALVPLFILWLGIGEAQKIGVIALACFFPVFLGTLGGMEQVDQKLIEVGRVCGLTRAEIARRIVLPAALPSIVIGLRIGLGYSWRALVGAELIASSAGLGYLIVDAQNLARTDIVLVGVLVIGVLGLLVDHIVRVAILRSAPWLRKDFELARA